MKKFLSFLAIGAIVLGMASCGGNDPQIGLPDNFVKHMIFDQQFEKDGSLRIFLFTNDEWNSQDGSGINWKGDGSCLVVYLYPQDVLKYAGNYEQGKNLGVWYMQAKDGKMVISNSPAKDGGTIKVTENADKSHTFDIDLSFEEIANYKGSIILK